MGSLDRVTSRSEIDLCRDPSDDVTAAEFVVGALGGAGAVAAGNVIRWVGDKSDSARYIVQGLRSAAQELGNKAE